MALNIYLLTQNEAKGYDTYSACVVAARSSSDARKIKPREEGYGGDDNDFSCGGAWARSPKAVKVELLGKAKSRTKRGLILASFHAG